MPHMNRVLPIVFAAALLGCRGTTPDAFAPAALGYGAILIRGRIVLPEGETRDGMMWMNFESTGESYRLPILAGETSLKRVEPDVYRLHPTRNTLGFVQPNLRVRIAGRYYTVPFPRDILRKDPVEVRPTKVVALGVVEARLLPIQRGRAPRVDIRLDDSNETRRRLIEDMIAKMMDAKTSIEIREATVSWTRALEQALVLVQGENERKKSYKAPR